ncbi:MAG: CRISPR-associated endonuclease Cas6 [Methanosarcinaceae archaeon]|nr:CRISPR-associated endonuclease Cas6 [Methanosarcinaceae archaeon]MDD4331141.1 CRISPR-associated endonuclease Cas6 [Methanosarcinaceae archaeon]MDD4749875.1 CRISPR-associated endonuclease Cas6 [Methanosarcinaceae archaeon]
MKIKTLNLTLVPNKKVDVDAAKLRGFFARKFNEYILLHQHKCDKTLYRYPLIQYKILKGIPLVLGINEGVEVLQEIYNKYDQLELAGNTYEILERKASVTEQELGLSEEYYTYNFETPWFALNQENFKDRYKKITPDKQEALLRRTLIGNLLSMSKSLGYTVPGQIKCETQLQAGRGRMKGVRIATFNGKFMVNFKLPDYFGLGKSVSRGFGTVKKCSL